MTNPLLTKWTTPFDFPPFSLINDSHFDEAFNQAIKEAEDKFDKISKPKIISVENNEEILEARVLSDSEALKIKYSDENILNKNQPSGTISKTIF